ncbi:MAG TPA: hypothetical protein VMS17_16135 [Gemmataceae bacterium]|nr:hypothetical protein [Gemmataceae bacterium]
MNHELICEWLGLPAGTWPPDHYRLLGLEPGESDLERIEQRIHERLDAVRHYQMKHPEQATEAMNRLAQAYVCLTEPASKRAYDAVLFGTAAPVAVAEAPPAKPERPDPLAWLFGPAGGLPRMLSATPPPLPRLPAPLPAPSQTIQPAESSPQESVDPVVAAAQQSKNARRGLGTKRALYTRVVATRKLLRVWEQLGTYVESAKRRLSLTTDGPELSRLLQEIRSLLRQFPRVIGAAGQPGYWVVTLSRQDDAARSFQALDSGQRDALSRDWEAGRKLIAAHRDYVRQEIRAMRKRTLKQRLLRAFYAAVTDQPTTFFLLLLLAALNVILWRLLWVWHVFEAK